MGFQIVTKDKTPIVPRRRVIDAKNIKKGELIYIGQSGQKATFKFTEDIRGITTDFEYEVNSRELRITGSKFCWCYNRLAIVNKGEIVVYIPEEPFEKHLYNCYKFKPNSLVLAEILHDIAYVVSKPEFGRKKVQGYKSK